MHAFVLLQHADATGAAVHALLMHAPVVTPVSRVWSRDWGIANTTLEDAFIKIASISSDFLH
jgi:hypothetical protein